MQDTIKQQIDFSFNRDSLVRELKKALFFVHKKSTMPIIKNIKIESIDGEIRIHSTDSINCYISDKLDNINSIENGEIIINGDSFFKILDKSDKGDYTLIETDESIVITGIDCKFELNNINSDEYPVFSIKDLNDDYNQFSIESDLLISSLKKTAFCTRDEPSRFQMNGISFQSNKQDSRLDIVATDTTRLALSTINDVKFFSCSEDFNIIINSFVAKFLIKFLSKEATVNIFIDVNRVFFTCNGETIISKLVSGIFPNYKKAIPESEFTITLNRELLIKSINKILPFTSYISKSIELTVDQNSITLSSSLPELGKASFNCTTITDNEIQPKMNFNPKYMLDGLKAINTDTINILIKNNKRPMIIEPTNQCNIEKYLYLIMPVLSRN